MNNPFRAHIGTEKIIAAPAAQLWEILTDFDCYAEWNPFTPKVEVDFRIGGAVTLYVNMTPGKKQIIQKEHLLHLEEGKSFGWGIDSWFPVRAMRIQKLVPIDAQTTRYITYEDFRGIMVPLIMFLYKNKIERGFQEVAEALEQRALSQVSN